ncbi:MAG TPA: hypothetical protein PKA95_18830, partial [Thermomicrobiales bacterium]|nr:hypothetical protein [Thermomicrobiales bacterium]
PAALAAAKFDFDPVGHYARPDVLRLRVRNPGGGGRKTALVGQESRVRSRESDGKRRNGGGEQRRRGSGVTRPVHS